MYFKFDSPNERGLSLCQFYFHDVSLGKGSGLDKKAAKKEAGKSLIDIYCFRFNRVGLF